MTTVAQENGGPLPPLDLDDARRAAHKIRLERVDAIENLERRVKDAADKKREFRKARGVHFVGAKSEGAGVGEAEEIAKLEAREAEHAADLAAGLVKVAQERVDLAKDDRAMLRHFSERSEHAA